MDFKGLKNLYNGFKINVLGAGSSMDKYTDEDFCDRVSIGMNYVYKSFHTKYTITRHLQVIRDWDKSDKGCFDRLIYPPYSDDLGGIMTSQIQNGIVFDTQELIWTRSISGTAIDLARYMGASEIHVYGVDLNNEYMDGYKSMQDDLSTEIFIETNKNQLQMVTDLMKLKYNVDVIFHK
jgi:hypothetical protein